MTASKVYNLEARIQQLEGTVEDQGLEDEDEADKSLALLEEEVARAAAKVAQSEKQVWRFNVSSKDCYSCIAERKPEHLN